MKHDGSTHEAWWLRGGDGEFVRRAYREVLGREADPEGFEHYREILEEGIFSREEVLASLYHSPEARGGRPPLPGIRRHLLSIYLKKTPILGTLYRGIRGLCLLPHLERLETFRRNALLHRRGERRRAFLRRWRELERRRRRERRVQRRLMALEDRVGESAAWRANRFPETLPPFLERSPYGGGEGGCPVPPALLDLPVGSRVLLSVAEVEEACRTMLRELGMAPASSESGEEIDAVLFAPGSAERDPEALAEALARFHRQLRGGGRIFLVLCNPGPTLCAAGGEASGDLGSLRSLLTGAGFGSLRLWYVDPLPLSLRSGPPEAGYRRIVLAGRKAERGADYPVGSPSGLTPETEGENG